MNVMPTTKVTVGILAGAVVVIAAWAARQFGQVELPAEIQGALQVVLTFAAQWLTPDNTSPNPPAAEDDDGDRPPV
jgi:hypothetical protein